MAGRGKGDRLEWDPPMQKKRPSLFADFKLSRAEKLRIEKWASTVKISRDLDAFAKTKPERKPRRQAS